MEFFIDIEDNSGNKFGAGPITNVTGFKYTARMDKAGEFEFQMPAGDEKADLLQARRYVRCYANVGGTITDIVLGIIDEIAIDATANPAMLTVRGFDVLRELATRSVGFYEATGYFGSIMGYIMSNFFPSGWSGSWIGLATEQVYVKFAGESVLSAIKKLAEQIDAHFYFYLDPNKIISFVSDSTDSGIRAVRSSTEPDAPELCVITSLEKTSESHDLITRIYPFGAGNGQNRLTLEYTTATAPSGYTLDKTNNYIKNDTAETTYGRIEKYLSYKNIAPISNSLTDLQNAADALFALAYNQLKNQSEPQVHYRLTTSGLNITDIHPTYSIRVIYDEFVDGYHAVAIDDDLYILSLTTQINKDGISVTGMDVATVAAYPANDYDAIVAQMEEGRVLEAHPQLTATKDRVGPYVLRIDSSHNAQFRFDIGDETTALNYAKLRFKLSPLRSSVTASAAESSHTHTVSIGASGSHTHDISHQHDINVQDNSSASSYPVVHLHTINKTLIYDSGGGGGTKPVPTDIISTTTSASATHTHPATATSSGSAHSHAMQYGIYQDTQYPSNLTIWIDGVDRTTALTGSSTIGGGSGIEETYDITQYLDNQSTLRGTHSIEFRCTGGQGEIEAELIMLMTVQAIAVT